MHITFANDAATAIGEAIDGDAAGDWFGWSVSFSCNGTRLAIGARYGRKNDQEYSYGKVKVFEWEEDALNFKQIGRSLYGKAANDNFSYSVALSSEGKTLAVGVNQYCLYDDDKMGCVDVYEWDEAAGEYKRLGQFLCGEEPDDLFGSALALAGNDRVLAVAAPETIETGLIQGAGRVEVFDIELFDILV